jgi:hypothetical protein
MLASPIGGSWRCGAGEKRPTPQLTSSVGRPSRCETTVSPFFRGCSRAIPGALRLFLNKCKRCFERTLLARLMDGYSELDHEAGHAVCIRLLGAEVGGAAIEPDYDFLGATWGANGDPKDFFIKDAAATNAALQTRFVILLLHFDGLCEGYRATQSLSGAPVGRSTQLAPGTGSNEGSRHLRGGDQQPRARRDHGRCR